MWTAAAIVLGLVAGLMAALAQFSQLFDGRRWVGTSVGAQFRILSLVFVFGIQPGARDLLSSAAPTQIPVYLVSAGTTFIVVFGILIFIWWRGTKQ